MVLDRLRAAAEVLARRGRPRTDLRPDRTRRTGGRAVRTPARGRARCCDLGRSRPRPALSCSGGRRRRSPSSTRRIARGVGCEALDQLNTLLVKALNGPPWPKRFECHSQNFVVVSDIDQKTCEEAARLLEDGYLAVHHGARTRAAHRRRPVPRLPLLGRGRLPRPGSRTSSATFRRTRPGIYSPVLKMPPDLEPARAAGTCCRP